jgi:hypothetical protein
MSKSTRGRPVVEAISASMLVFVILTIFVLLLNDKSISLLESEIKRGLVNSVTAAATIIDGDLHKTFDGNTTRTDPVYLSAIEPLEKIRRATADVPYIYTNILVGNNIHFLLNPSPQKAVDGIIPDPPALMDIYNDPAKELVEALRVGSITVSEDPYEDEWGKFISAYAPFYDSNHKLVGTLGMDLELSGFESRLLPLKMLFEKTFVIIIFICLVVGVIIFLSRKQSRGLLMELHHTNEVNNILDKFYSLRMEEVITFLDKLHSSKKSDILIERAKQYFQSLLTSEQTQKGNVMLALPLLENRIIDSVPGIALRFLGFTHGIIPEDSEVTEATVDSVVDILKMYKKACSHQKELIVDINVKADKTHHMLLELSLPLSETNELLFNPMESIGDLTSVGEATATKIRWISALSRLVSEGGYARNTTIRSTEYLVVGIFVNKTDDLNNHQ